MKKFKIIDTWISILLIIGFFIASIIRLDYTFITGYFVVGGWQVVSMIIHSINGWFMQKDGKRFRYQFAVGIILLLALAGWALNPLLYLIMVVMIFAAPFMAIVYTMICYKEVYLKMQRPLALLK